MQFCIASYKHAAIGHLRPVKFKIVCNAPGDVSMKTAKIIFMNEVYSI